MPGSMIKQFTFNHFEVNCYLVIDEATKQCAIIDPACEASFEDAQLSQFIEQEGLTVTHILLTHAHVDHIAGLRQVCDHYKLPVTMHAEGRKLLKQAALYGDMMGFAVDDMGRIYMEPHKYLNNFISMWYLLIILLIGVVLVLFGIGKTIVSKDYVGGIWPAGIGTVLTVLALLLCSAWNNTAYYPSTADLQSSLTLDNSCSSEFTLTTMFYVSLLVPFVLAYIVYAWRAIDAKKLDKDDIKNDHAY